MYKVDNSEKRFTVLQFIFPDEKILEPGFWILGSQASPAWIEYDPRITVTSHNGCWKLTSPKIEQLLFFLMYKVDKSEKRFTVVFL